MTNPKADTARDLAKACRSLEKASRSKTPDDARAGRLLTKTELAIIAFRDEYGLSDTVADSAKMVPFESVDTAVHLGTPESLSVTLFILQNGEIELGARWRWGDPMEFYRYRYGVREVQRFYMHMLYLLDYELPGPPGSHPHELPPSQCLRFHRLPKSAKEPWILSSVPNIRKGRGLGIHLSQKRAIELCQVLAEPLGWELRG